MRPPAAALLLLFCACVSPVKVTKPGGDYAGLFFAQGTSYEVELLTVTDTSLLFATQGRVWQAPLTDVLRIHIQGYSLKTEKTAFLVGLGLADAFFVALMLKSGSPWLSPLLAGVMVGSVFWTMSGEPRVDFRPPLTPRDREQLALYCRYPQGLDGPQRQKLLKHYGQFGFLEHRDLPATRQYR